MHLNCILPGSLVQVVDILRHEHDLAGELGQNGRRRFEEEFTPATMIRRLESLYQVAVEAPRTTLTTT